MTEIDFSREGYPYTRQPPEGSYSLSEEDQLIRLTICPLLSSLLPEQRKEFYAQVIRSYAPDTPHPHDQTVSVIIRGLPIAELHEVATALGYITQVESS